FAVVSGDCGTGKTTTIRKFRDSLDASKYMVMYLSDSKLTPRHFYKGLLEQLGCEAKFYRGDAKRQLHREIELLRGIHNLLPVVVVDEAHLLDKEMLEEVRFLLNFKMDAQSPMALILVGQNELWDRLHLRKRMNERTLSPVNSPAILKEKQERTGNINGFTRKKENMGAENIRISFKWCECYSLVRTE
ncbi:MAG: ATP-binding protein, partial [Crenarchaeota archaeon]|nr:ATP-binding protein [Thermoproteota archaeon]